MSFWSWKTVHLPQLELSKKKQEIGEEEEQGKVYEGHKENIQQAKTLTADLKKVI